MRKNINVQNSAQPFNIKTQILNISNQNIHNLIYSSLFHWDEESITTAYLASIYGKEYSIDGNCFQCGLPFSACPNGHTPPLPTSGRIASFNRYQESKKSGSDFLLSYKPINLKQQRILIQAKVITDDTPMNETTWKKIFHKNFAQFRKIKHFIQKHNADAYYLFYSLSRSPHHRLPTRCTTHTSPYDTIALLISADEIYRIYQSRPSWKRDKSPFSQIIAPDTIPLTCLFKHGPQSSGSANTPPSDQNFENPLIPPEVDNRNGNAPSESTLGKKETILNEPKIPEIIIDERLIVASEIKNSAFSLATASNVDIILRREPIVKSISFILSLLKPDEFTTFLDIKELLYPSEFPFEGNSPVFHILRKLVSITFEKIELKHIKMTLNEFLYYVADFQNIEEVKSGDLLSAIKVALEVGEVEDAFIKEFESVFSEEFDSIFEENTNQKVSKSDTRWKIGYNFICNIAPTKVPYGEILEKEIKPSVLSLKILPEDAVKVVEKKPSAESGSIDLNGSLGGSYENVRKLDILEEFYPFLHHKDGFLKIGENSNEASYLGADKLRERIKLFMESKNSSIDIENRL